MNLKQNILKRLNEKLIPFFGKIQTQRHLLGIRNGIMATLPFILVGSIFLILLNLPISSEKYLQNYMDRELVYAFDLINRFTFGVMALYMAIGIGSEMARLSRISSTQGAIIGAMGYIMWMLPLSINIVEQKLANIENLGKEQIEIIKQFNGGLWINIKQLGGTTAFVAILSSTTSIEIYRVCLKYKITIKMPKQVPEAVSNSFAALIPIFAISAIIGFVRYYVGFNLSTFLGDVLAPMKGFLTKNLAGALIVIFLIAFLWWFGIHGGSLVQSITRPFWLTELDENKNIFKGEKKGDYANFVEPFFQWFAQIGGVGNTLGLVLFALFYAKSTTMKSISRTSLVPSLFNINEPLLFGLPIISNPFLWIPFVLGPVISAIIGYIMQKLLGIHWVAMAPWTLPGPIGAFFASGNQWQAVVGNLTLIGSCILIWCPFVIAYDKFMIKKEKVDIESRIV